MSNATAPVALMRQHLIDPEVCIRCNTCEETCPVHAITHDSRNYVVNAAICEGCQACVAPCPTGSIDHWRMVPKDAPYTLQQQLGWDELPPEREFDADTVALAPVTLQVNAARSRSSSVPPKSAAHAEVNLYTPNKPVVATVMGNLRLTAEDAQADVRHIVLDFAAHRFPVLEGQAIGIVAPGLDASGRPHFPRMYSVASPRTGEREGYNNLALTVKRVTVGDDGKPWRGVASNYLCDLKKGDTVTVVGPFGQTFLMPDHGGANLLMICTGTGSAPMRAMTERRRRLLLAGKPNAGKLMLFFGARKPEELPYFGPLAKLPASFITTHLAFSRIPGQPRTYVQDRMREQALNVAELLRGDTCVYICGLRGMEDGVLQALDDACSRAGMDWSALYARLVDDGRFHVETY